MNVNGLFCKTDQLASVKTDGQLVRCWTRSGTQFVFRSIGEAERLIAPLSEVALWQSRKGLSKLSKRELLSHLAEFEEHRV